jgi:hypothetical protein
MTLQSAQPLTLASHRNVLGDLGRVDALTGVFEPIIRKMWQNGRFITLWASIASYLLNIEQRKLDYLEKTGPETPLPPKISHALGWNPDTIFSYKYSILNPLSLQRFFIKFINYSSE